ncbi:MAG: threonine/serine exporter family protein [Acidobacteria bacterium]|nr:threonine/serine exporter family protein [Acidobacteriota bacterium]
MNSEISSEELILTDTEPNATDPRIAFAVKLGQALHRFGTSTHRLEEMMNLVLQKLGLDGQFFVTPTGIFASFGSPEEHRTSLIRVESTEVDLGKLALLDKLVNQVIKGELSVAEGAVEIETVLTSPPRYGAWLTTICFALASGSSARFLGGGWREVLVTTVSGLIVGGLALLMGRFKHTDRVFEPIGAMVSAFVAVWVAQYLQPFSVYIGTLSGLIVLIPGLTVTTAIRELVTRNLISGTARLMGALLLFFQIGFGVALGWKIGRLFSAASMVGKPLALPYWTLWIALTISPLCFAVLFRAMPRELIWIMLSCWLSFSGARWGALWLGPELGVCVGAILIGAWSNLYSRLSRKPAAITMVPGMMLLVPGSIGFGSLASFIEKDVVSAVETAFSMILVAVALVTGLLIANVIMPPRKIL